MIDFLTSPVTFLLVFTFLFAVTSKAKLAIRRLTTICLFTCWAMCTPAAANWMVWALESQADAPHGCEPEPNAVAVVLTGGVDRSPSDEKDVAALSKASLSRIAFAVRWAESHPENHFILSGGGPFPVAESVVARYVMQRMSYRGGIPIGIEITSQTTWESAVNVAAMPIDRKNKIFLLTSRLHMPRAAMAFRANGFLVCPVSTDSSYIKGGGIGYFIPQITAVEKFSAVLHEVVGLVYYGLILASGG